MADTCENLSLKEVREKTMDELWGDAVEATWNQFEKLEKQGKLSRLGKEDLRELRDWQREDPEFCLRKRRYWRLMFYYFDSDACSNDTLYRRLSFNRHPEDGHPVLNEDTDETTYPYNFNWPLKKDLVYLQLENELQKCDKIKLNNPCDVNDKEVMKVEEELRFEFSNKSEEDAYWNQKRLEYLNDFDEDTLYPSELGNFHDVNILEARKIAEQPRFISLDWREVHECLNGLVRRWETEAYYKAAHDFLFCLLGGQEQLLLRTDYEGFLGTMAKKFQFKGGIYAVTRLVRVFDGLAEQCHPLKADSQETSLFPSLGFRDADPRFFDEDPGWNAKMRRRINDFLEVEEKTVSRQPLTRAEYIRKKLKLAKEIGIVGEDKYTGQDVEIFREIFFEESNALDKLTLLG